MGARSSGAAAPTTAGQVSGVVGFRRATHISGTSRSGSSMWIDDTGMGRSPRDRRTCMNRIPTVLSAWSVAIIAAAGCERSIKYVEPPASSYSAGRFVLATEFADTVTGAMISPEFFSASNARPLLGRFFLPVEYEFVREPVVVISNKLWRQRFNSAPQLIGTRVQLNGRPVTVVGVAPPGFGWPRDAAVWVPRVPR